MKQTVRFQIESPLSLVEQGVITRVELACGEIDFGEYVVMPERENHEQDAQISWGDTVKVAWINAMAGKS